MGALLVRTAAGRSWPLIIILKIVMIFTKKDRAHIKSAQSKGFIAKLPHLA
jgi:hypothetical protein